MTDYKINDRVSWNSPQGRVQGTVLKKLTSNSEYEGLQVTATVDEPRYVVKSSSTCKVAAHKADGLNKN